MLTTNKFVQITSDWLNIYNSYIRLNTNKDFIRMNFNNTTIAIYSGWKLALFVCTKLCILKYIVLIMISNFVRIFNCPNSKNIIPLLVSSSIIKSFFSFHLSWSYPRIGPILSK